MTLLKTGHAPLTGGCMTLQIRWLHLPAKISLAWLHEPANRQIGRWTPHEECPSSWIVAQFKASAAALPPAAGDRPPASARQRTPVRLRPRRSGASVRKVPPASYQPDEPGLARPRTWRDSA
jgi:hypothetical protein